MKLNTYSCFFGTNSEKKVIWELTERCQQNCINCCNTHRREGNEISFNQVQSITNQLMQYGVKHVVLTGGEPLLCKEFLRIIEYISSRNMSITICTNGVLLGKYAKDLKYYGVNKVIVSLDTLSPTLYDYLRGTSNAMPVVLNSIDASKSEGLKTAIHAVLSEKNRYEISNLLKYAQINRLQFSMSCSVDKKGSQNGFFLKKQLINSVYDFLGEKDIQVDKSFLLTRTECRAGIKVFGIKSNGTFSPCLWISDFSNEYDSYSLQSIINENLNFNRKMCHAMTLCNRHSKTIQESFTVECDFSCE